MRLIIDSSFADLDQFYWLTDDVLAISPDRLPTLPSTDDRRSNFTRISWNYAETQHTDPNVSAIQQGLCSTLCLIGLKLKFSNIIGHIQFRELKWLRKTAGKQFSTLSKKIKKESSLHQFRLKRILWVDLQRGEAEWWKRTINERHLSQREVFEKHLSGKRRLAITWVNTEV